MQFFVVFQKRSSRSQGWKHDKSLSFGCFSSLSRGCKHWETSKNRVLHVAWLPMYFHKAPNLETWFVAQYGCKNWPTVLHDSMDGCIFRNIALKTSNPSRTLALWVYGRLRFSRHRFKNEQPLSCRFFFSMGGLRGMTKTYFRPSFRARDYSGSCRNYGFW